MIEKCYEFSMMKVDCLLIDWFSDCSSDWSSDWSSDCSSSWLYEGGRGDTSNEVSGRLYNEMRANRLYNCLLNTDENSDDWKNFENRDNSFCCTDDSQDDDSFRDDRRFACHE
jgi:hypothetical protein